MVAAAVGLALLTGLGGCQTANDVAMKVGAPPEGAVKLRALETRRFDTTDEKAMLTAASQTLQDLGFTLTESAVDLGVLVASKQRDAEEAGEVAGRVALSLALALLGSYQPPDWDKDQTIIVMVVTNPAGSGGQLDVRVSFDRTIRTHQGLTRTERLDDPAIYQGFFAKLSGGVFLEGHAL